MQKPMVSPLQASINRLGGQLPQLIITDENDVLKDEGEAYAYKLIQAGINVAVVRDVGTIYDFVILNTLADIPATCSAIGLVNEILRVFC